MFQVLTHFPSLKDASPHSCTTTSMMHNTILLRYQRSCCRRTPSHRATHDPRGGHIRRPQEKYETRVLTPRGGQIRDAPRVDHCDSPNVHQPTHIAVLIWRHSSTVIDTRQSRNLSHSTIVLIHLYRLPITTQHSKHLGTTNTTSFDVC